MACKLRQAKQFDSNGTPTSTTIVVTLDSDVKQGSALAIYGCWGNAGVSAFVSITDSQGDKVNELSRLDNGGDAHMTFFVKNCTAGAHTITLTVSPAQGYREMVVHEIEGADTFWPVDQHLLVNDAGGVGADAITTGNVTTKFDGEYIFGATYTDNTVTNNLTAGTGFGTMDTNFAGGVDAAPFGSEHQIQSSAGAIAVTFTPDNAQQNTVCIITFKPAPATDIGYTIG